MSNPFDLFDTAAQTAAARRAAEDAAAAQQRAMTAEAIRAKVAADAALRSAQEEERRLRNFVDGFVHAVIKVAETRRWSPTAIQAARRYSMALASRPEVTIPPIDPQMGEIIRGKFTYGIVLQGDTFPSGWLNGQRQEWFLELFAKESGQTTNHHLRIRPGEGPKVVHSSTSRSTANLLPAATTPRTKGKDPRPAHLRMGRPGGRRTTAA